MLGVVLLYVGIVLISNGLYRLEGIQDKSNVVMNIFTGGLGLILNIIAIFIQQSIRFLNLTNVFMAGLVYLLRLTRFQQVYCASRQTTVVMLSTVLSGGCGVFSG